MPRKYTLKEWLKTKGLTPEQFAPQVGCDRATIYRIMGNSGYDPKLSTALAIEKATKGAVPMRALAREE